MKSLSSMSWYARRLGRMSPGEMAWRARDQALRLAWTRRQVRQGEVPESLDGLPVLRNRCFTSALPPGTAELVPSSARSAITLAADRILKGEWEMLGLVRDDLDAPDWFADPVTGRRSDPARYAFKVNHRSEEEVGNVKQVWELSRLQHLTLLACAYYLTGSEAYASRAASQLNSWWRENPFLSGVHWTSGIELGIRLINFAWIRRLLDSWPGVTALFEDSPLALRQIWWHQEYLARFVSHGSSANNHVIAEAAGQFAASCAFAWFPSSAAWRQASGELLERTLASNTFGSGINKELATDYHGFVFELGACAAAEAAAAGYPVSDETWRRLGSMADCMAALIDSTGRPPRQGDSDEGHVVLLDAPAHNRWPGLLSVGAALFGPSGWWPDVVFGASSVLLGALAGPFRPLPGRPGRRPSRFADAGITILRTEPGSLPELWVRCDGGPHGFGSIAAHAHADALSVEVRHDGTDILADPGTYCYHGEPEWRSYFRSTVAHNTVEIGAADQSASGGPFLWTRHAAAAEGDVSETEWTAVHDGYLSLRPPARHRRSVRLDRETRTLEITDVITGAGHPVRVAFHLGPAVEARLTGTEAVLDWAVGQARLELPSDLTWTAHKGETSPIVGWYSPSLGRKEPTVALLGVGNCRQDMPLVTRLTFCELSGARAEEP